MSANSTCGFIVALRLEQKLRKYGAPKIIKLDTRRGKSSGRWRLREKHRCVSAGTHRSIENRGRIHCRQNARREYFRRRPGVGIQEWPDQNGALTNINVFLRNAEVHLANRCREMMRPARRPA